METYAILSAPDADGKVSVKRVSDGMVSRCKSSWLSPVSPNVFQAASRTKAIRLEGLEWSTEG